MQIHKTVHRLRTANATTVALQFPEGLQMYACMIGDILEAFTPAKHIIILGGACSGTDRLIRWD